MACTTPCMWHKVSKCNLTKGVSVTETEEERKKTDLIFAFVCSLCLGTKFSWYFLLATLILLDEPTYAWEIVQVLCLLLFLYHDTFWFRIYVSVRWKQMVCACYKILWLPLLNIKNKWFSAFSIRISL